MKTVKCGVNSCGGPVHRQVLFGLQDLRPVLRGGGAELQRLIDRQSRFVDELVAESDSLRRLRGLLTDDVAPEVRLPLEVHPGLGCRHREGQQHTERCKCGDTMRRLIHRLGAPCPSAAFALSAGVLAGGPVRPPLNRQRAHEVVAGRRCGRFSQRTEGREALGRPPSMQAYLRETSSIRKLVGRLKSVVARKRTRTVWPRQLARLNDFCE